MSERTLNDQEKVVLEQLGDAIRLARDKDKIEEAAHFAAQAYNIVNPGAQIKVPTIGEVEDLQSPLKEARHKAGWSASRS